MESVGVSPEEVRVKLEELHGARMGVSEFLRYGELIHQFSWRPGPHDEFHTSRVLALTASGGRLVQHENPNININQPALEITAVIHDAFRVIDHKPDLGHGWRAAQWANQALRGVIDKPTLSQIMFLCTYHDLPDKLKLLPKTVLQNTPLLLALALFKDFDAADRIRNGNDLKPRFLRLGVSRVLLPLAKKLHDATELRRDEGTPAIEIVASEAKRLGLVIE